MRRLGLFSSLFHLRRPALAFVGCCGPSWAFVGVVRANYGCGGYEINCTLKKKLSYGPNDASSVVWALFHLCFIFVGLRWPSLADVGLRGRRPGQLCVWWVRNKLFIQKKTHLWPKRRISRRLGLFSSLFHLRRPALAFVGCCGPSFAFVSVIRANHAMGVVGKR